jgi:hypothetical protein
MPSKSKSQARLFAAVAHNPKFAKKVGIPVSVGKEFNDADKGKKFKAGGDVKKKKFKLFGGAESKAEEQAEKKAAPSKAAYAKKEQSEPGETKFACGGAVKKAKGGSVDGVAQRGRTKGTMR